MLKESLLSKEIKVITEVEKIWILFEKDTEDKISQDEIIEYLRQMADPKVELFPR